MLSHCYKYNFEHQSLHPTDLQKAQLTDRGFSIFQHMEAFFEAQIQHLPCAKILRDEANAKPGSSDLWNVPLMFPSEIIACGGTCSKTLLDIEWHLWYAACHDELEMMHKHLLTRTGLISYKLKYLHGQYDGTWSSQMINSRSNKITNCAAKYCTSFKVMAKYASDVGRVAPELHQLHEQDICGINWAAMDDTQEIDIRLSWIWSSTGINISNNEAMHDSEWHLRQYSLYWHFFCRLAYCMVQGFCTSPSMARRMPPATLPPFGYLPPKKGSEKYIIFPSIFWLTSPLTNFFYPGHKISRKSWHFTIYFTPVK